MEIELLSAEGFRRRIAGLEDPSRKVDRLAEGLSMLRAGV